RDAVASMTEGEVPHGPFEQVAREAFTVEGNADGAWPGPRVAGEGRAEDGEPHPAGRGRARAGRARPSGGPGLQDGARPREEGEEEASRPEGRLPRPGGPCRLGLRDPVGA